LITHNHIVVDYDVVIYQNFKIGDKFLIELKVNFNRDTEFLVYDKTLALDMLFHFNSIQSNNNVNKIEKVR
jgi:hypothetical protein